MYVYIKIILILFHAVPATFSGPLKNRKRAILKVSWCKDNYLLGVS